ncbi:YbaK/EbsC family protein [Nocardia alni]|uniref:YbaK/EbsC family protein n=1 Tax=Nocardia alni TaxID=2815723 RepID=UPI001C244659|nr:YbaK/EbsC family protein [Nocardia alni]
MTSSWTTGGVLDVVPAVEHPDLLADPVRKALDGLEGADRWGVAEIDPELADTAAFCERYQVGLEVSANCVVVAAKRAGEIRYAACMVLATDRADVNGIIRRHLDARKISFAPMTEAVGLTAMEYGGITPLGLPADWPLLIDTAVARSPEVVVGSGLRRSKLFVPGSALTTLPTAETLTLALNR